MSARNVEYLVAAGVHVHDALEAVDQNLAVPYELEALYWVRVVGHLRQVQNDKLSIPRLTYI